MGVMIDKHHLFFKLQHFVLAAKFLTKKGNYATS